MADVALVTSSFLPRIGGVEEHVRNVALQLRDDGLDVVIWTVDQGEDTPATVHGIPVRALACPLPTRSARGLLSFAWRAPVAAAQWLGALARDRPAVLHVHCFGPNGVWALPAALGRRLVVTSHGETTADADRVYDRAGMLSFALRVALRRADAVTAVAPATMDDLVGRFGLRRDRACLISNGVALDEPAGVVPPGLPERFILGLGRLVQTKGFDLLLAAFARAELPPDVGLVIAGEGNQADALAARASDLGISDRVVMTGRLDRGEVVAVLARAAALSVPSRVEPFGIVVLEGWRAGIPVIATDRGGPADPIVDGSDGMLIDTADTAAFAIALADVFADPVGASRIGAAGRERAGEFTWTGVAASYRALYTLPDGVATRR